MSASAEHPVASSSENVQIPALKGPHAGDEKKPKDKKKSQPFNLEAEKDSMKVAIAESSIAATNLTNALQSINREQERISDNALAVQRFEICKKLRRKVLRYVGRLSAYILGSPN